MNVDYLTLYKEIKSYLIEKHPKSTKEKTKKVKEFFYEKYANDYNVMYSRKGSSEYLTDLLITSFKPKDLFQQDKKFTIVPEEIKAYLAVESELGGVSASWAGGLMKNVSEDFCKLGVTE